MAKKLICDKCEKEYKCGSIIDITDHKVAFDEIYLEGKRASYDLCEDCRKELIAWIFQRLQKKGGEQEWKA